MRIASWNVNSVRARLHNILDWLSNLEIDVILIQEIKCVEEQFPRLEFEALGYEVAINGQKSYNGVAILSKSPITEVKNGLPNYIEDEQSRYIEAKIKGVVFASIYLPNGNPINSDKFNYKIKWMERLKNHSKQLLDLELPIVLGGDFNVVPCDDDVHDPISWQNDALCQPQTRARFRTMLNFGLTEAWRSLHNEVGYSYWDYQAGRWQKDEGVRIDHWLLSPQAADRLVGCEIDKGPRGKEKASDHTPVILELS